jgi:hypothetical protein
MHPTTARQTRPPSPPPAPQSPPVAVPAVPTPTSSMELIEPVSPDTAASGEISEAEEIESTPEHGEPHDIYLDGSLVRTRARLVACDAELGPSQSAALMLWQGESCNGLYSGDFAANVVLILRPAQGNDGPVQMRHCTLGGEPLGTIAEEMRAAYEAISGEEGRVTLVASGSSIRDELNALREERQAQGVDLNTVVDGLITELELDLPLTEMAAQEPGAEPPPTPMERFEGLQATLMFGHVNWVSELAQALDADLLLLQTPAVYVSALGEIDGFSDMPEAEPSET